MLWIIFVKFPFQINAVSSTVFKHILCYFYYNVMCVCTWPITLEDTALTCH